MLSNWQNSQYLTSEWFYRPFTMNEEGWTLAVNSRYNEGQFLMQQPDVYLSYKGGHSQKKASFYADQQFDKPNAPMYLGLVD